MPPGALEPPDCSALPAAPTDVVAAAEASDTPIIDAELSAGETQFLLEWTDSEGENWWRTEPTTDATITYDGGGLRGEWWPIWGVSGQLPCTPEARAYVWFALMDGTFDPLVPGDYPLAAVGLDVPDKEQGDSAEPPPPVGSVTVTEAGDGLASGYLTGSGGGPLISFFTQEEIGADYAVYGLAFRDVPAEWVVGDEE